MLGTHVFKAPFLSREFEEGHTMTVALPTSLPDSSLASLSPILFIVTAVMSHSM